MSESKVPNWVIEGIGLVDQEIDLNQKTKNHLQSVRKRIKEMTVEEIVQLFINVLQNYSSETVLECLFRISKEFIITLGKDRWRAIWYLFQEKENEEDVVKVFIQFAKDHHDIIPDKESDKREEEFLRKYMR